GPRVERSDRALAPAERVGRGLLDLEIDAQHDLSRGSAIAEVARLPNRDWVGRILADERVGVRGLYAGEAELRGRVPDHLRERPILVGAREAGVGFLARRD